MIKNYFKVQIKKTYKYGNNKQGPWLYMEKVEKFFNSYKDAKSYIKSQYSHVKTTYPIYNDDINHVPEKIGKIYAYKDKNEDGLSYWQDWVTISKINEVSCI